MNLLPESYKKELRYEAWRRFVIAFGSYLGAILVIANVLLLPPYFFVLFQIDASRDRLEALRSSQEYRTVEESNERVRKINRYLRIVTALENENKPVIPILEDLYGRANAHITILTAVLTRTPDGVGAVKLFGEADHRDDLALFEEDLAKSPYIKVKPNSPITNYLKERDVRYTLTLDLNL